MKLWIGNLAPEITDADLNAFLEKYGLPPRTAIQRVAGDGTHPGALVTFADVQVEDLYHAAFRIDGLYWKPQALAVQVIQH